MSRRHYQHEGQWYDAEDVRIGKRGFGILLYSVVYLVVGATLLGGFFWVAEWWMGPSAPPAPAIYAAPLVQNIERGESIAIMLFGHDGIYVCAFPDVSRETVLDPARCENIQPIIDRLRAAEPEP